MKISFATVALLLFIPTSLYASDCDSGVTPCEAYGSAEAVFVGKVTRIVPELIRDIWTRDEDYDQMAYVDVEKTFKGFYGSRIVLHQWGRKRAPKFILGSRYLFYANHDRATGQWRVKPCGRTRMAEYVQDDLRYLNGLPASAGRTRFAGEIVRYDINSENPQGITKRLSGIRVTITGEGKEYKVVTDANGVYEIYDLPAGKYRIQPDIPYGLTFFAAIHDRVDLAKTRSLDIDVRTGGCLELTILLTTDRSVPKGKDSRIGN